MIFFDILSIWTPWVLKHQWKIHLSCVTPKKWPKSSIFHAKPRRECVNCFSLLSTNVSMPPEFYLNWRQCPPNSIPIGVNGSMGWQSGAIDAFMNDILEPDKIWQISDYLPDWCSNTAYFETSLEANCHSQTSRKSPYRVISSRSIQKLGSLCCAFRHSQSWIQTSFMWKMPRNGIWCGVWASSSGLKE